MEHPFTFEDFAEGVMSGPWPEKDELSRRFRELEDDRRDGCDERELSRQYATAALAASRKQTLRILRQYREFDKTGTVPF